MTLKQRFRGIHDSAVELLLDPVPVRWDQPRISDVAGKSASFRTTARHAATGEGVFGTAFR